jgi:hypothetical protein
MGRQEKPPKRYYLARVQRKPQWGVVSLDLARSSRRIRPQRESWLLILLVVYYSMNTVANWAVIVKERDGLLSDFI